MLYVYALTIHGQFHQHMNPRLPDLMFCSRLVDVELFSELLLKSVDKHDLATLLACVGKTVSMPR